MSARPKAIYQIIHPTTGAVEFIEKGGKLYAWATYCTFPSQPEKGPRHLGWSNADTAEGALKSARAGYKYGTDYHAVPVKLTTAGDRDAYLARRAILVGTDAKRAKWARVLTAAAVDYLRTRHDDPDSLIAKEHVADMVDQAMHYLGADHIDRQRYKEIAGRVLVGADVAARHFLIAERGLSHRDRAEVAERKLTSYLQARDGLITRLEAITLAVAAHERHVAAESEGRGNGCPVKWATGKPCENCNH